MHFTGPLSSTTESTLPPNSTDELSNEFLENVGIIFENYLYGYRKVVITLSLWNSSEDMLNTFMVYLYVLYMYIDFLDLSF